MHNRTYLERVGPTYRQASGGQEPVHVAHGEVGRRRLEAMVRPSLEDRRTRQAYKSREIKEKFEGNSLLFVCFF